MKIMHVKPTKKQIPTRHATTMPVLASFFLPLLRLTWMAESVASSIAPPFIAFPITSKNTVVSRREKAHFIKGQQSYSKRHQEHSNIGAYGIPRIMLILPGKQHPKPCYHATNRGNHHYNKAYSRNITDHVLPFFLYAFRKRSFNT